jgi:5'-nucleotidase/UDP-sugar diphosphatase
MIESIRKGEPSVLLLDSGAVFDHQSDNAKLHLQAMELMGYDALNLGIPELLLGKEFLERTSSQVTFPYIASNLLYGGSRLPWTREYVIKEVGGMKVAILGILDPDDLKSPPPDDVKGFTVISPKAALDRLLPEVRGKADLVILLSQLGEARTLALVEAARGIGIDVAIFSERNYLVKPPEKNAILLQTWSRGTGVGLVTITLGDKRILSVSERRDVPLDPSVPDNERILWLVETYKRERAIKEEKPNKERMEWLQLTPEEFMKRYRKEQTEQKKGAAQ